MGTQVTWMVSSDETLPQNCNKKWGCVESTAPEIYRQTTSFKLGFASSFVNYLTKENDVITLENNTFIGLSLWKMLKNSLDRELHNPSINPSEDA